VNDSSPPPPCQVLSSSGPGPSESPGCPGSLSCAGGLAALRGSGGRSAGGPAGFLSSPPQALPGPLPCGPFSAPGPGPEADFFGPGAPPEALYLESSIAKVLKKPRKLAKIGALAEKWELAEARKEARDLAERVAGYLVSGEDIETAEARRSEDLARKREKEIRCGAWGLVGETEAGERFMRQTDCGREWCPRCRESTHKRRLARWIPKALKIGSMGYHVFTYPLAERPRTARELGKFEWVTTEILKRQGFDRGLCKYHWFGDKSVGVWNPHLNYLTESGHLEPELIAALKKEICAELGLSQVVYNYHYSSDRPRKIFWLKYVTRPTFLNKTWAPDMADELYNFRNSITWGAWGDPGPRKNLKAEAVRLERAAAGYFNDKWGLPRAEKSLAYMEQIKAGFSPLTGLPIKWRQRVKIEEKILEPGWAQIWDGLWQYKPPAEHVLIYRLFKDYLKSCEEAGGP